MRPEDEICLCFHVTRRKVENFIRVEQPRRVGQLSECFGAGTGCGWCRPFLRKLFKAAIDHGDLSELSQLSPEEYARQRTRYQLSKSSQPPPRNPGIDEQA